MDRYFNQLIEDLKNAAKRKRPPKMELDPELEVVRGAEEYLYGTPYMLGVLLGISKNTFPPPEKLNENQLEQLATEIEYLWAEFNFHPVFPDDLPAIFRYKLLLSKWDEPVQYVSAGNIHVEFCDYDTENCPFPKKYCMCKDFEDEIDNDHDSYLDTNNKFEISILDKELAEISEKDSSKYIIEEKLEKYVNYLIGDLNKATEKILNKPSFPDNINIRSTIDINELINNEFISIEELTGIPVSSFPEHIDMDGIQTRKVLKAMLELLDAYKLKVYYPKTLPFEFKYETLREGWDITYIKHLSNSGDDIDFCTNDPNTCPYGKYCDCGDAEFTDVKNILSEDIDFDDSELPF